MKPQGNILPDSYLENMKELLGSDFNKYIESFDNTRLYGLRVNTLKISTEEFEKICPFKISKIPWIDNIILRVYIIYKSQVQ